MKINNRGIRALFIYRAERLIPCIILSYAVFSLTSLFFADNSKDVKNMSISEIIFEHEGNIQALNNREKSALKRNFSTKSTEDLTELAIASNLNKLLQRRSMFGYTSSNIVKAENGAQFDIEKIISDLNLNKEKRVAVIAKELGIDWKREKGEYAKLAGIEGNYVGSLDQNQKIRSYLIRNAQEIYKDKHGWNEWDTLALVPQKVEKVKMNSQPINGQATYNGVTLKVSAPAESFPEGTILKIKSLGDDETMTTFDITLKEVQLLAQVDEVEFDAPMASFDISFYAANDTDFSTELQPAEGKSVSVVFDYADNDEFKDSEDGGFIAIYHMEDNDEKSIANLVSVKNPEEIKENTKSDFLSIYANTLSVYILTVVSDLDEDFSENNETIIFDAGTGGFIADDNIILSTTGMDIDSIYTGKILSRNDGISLPNIKVASGYNFGGWYDENGFLGNAGTKFRLGNSDNHKIYASLYTDNSDGNIGDVNENLDEDRDLDISGNNSEDEVIINNVAYAPSEEEIQKYGQEIFNAYNWAINNGITTIDDINQAKLNKKITRAELAKMMVVFMSGVLEKSPIITDEVNYRDVDSQKLGDLAGYIQLAYQYQIMGINSDGTPIEDFNPSKTVTRAEFATVLSRVLYGDTYNQSGNNYYEKHIEALEKANILSNTNPDLVEARGWIMTMLYNTQS